MLVQTHSDEVVPLLQERLTNTIKSVNKDYELVKRIKKIQSDLNEVKDLFPAVKESEKKLLELSSKVSKLDRSFDSQTLNFFLDGVDAEINNIKNSIPELRQSLLAERENVEERTHRQESGDNKGSKDRRGLSELEKMILLDPAMDNLKVSYDRLDQLQLKMCLLFLSIFPENTVIKRRPLIYWWIGEGLIKTEDDGEQNFKELLKRDLIKPCFIENSPVWNEFQLHPWIRYMLISVAKKEHLFDFDPKGTPTFDNNNDLSRRACLASNGGISLGDNSGVLGQLRTIFNVHERYLDFPAQMVAKLEKLVVLQLGRWQGSPEHHIEVKSEAFLKELRTQKHLKYLSFRGISRITVLPPSIVELFNLEILDLKACHNLELLPPDIEKLRKLTHLDVSECYLLESMPKGLEKLKSLQVLKGFVIGNSKKTPCRIKDLTSLGELKRFSVHIGNEAMIIEREFDDLKSLIKVKCLKISWGVVSQKLNDQVIKQPFSFPPSLEKLVLEGIPLGKPDWLKPSKLKGLKKLYIRGGIVNSLDHGEATSWEDVEILRLKYLSNLAITLPKVKKMFPNLKHELKIEREETTKEVPESEKREELGI